MEMIVEKAKRDCNGCDCSFTEKTDLFYYHIIQELKQDTTPVIERFEEVVRSYVKGALNEKDVENARKMLKCSVHRRAICSDNYIYFEKTILSVKI